MSLILGVGSGIFLIFFFIIILFIFAIFTYSTKTGRIIFWSLLIIFLAIVIGLLHSPTKSEIKNQEDEEDEINNKWSIIPSFATFIYLGVIVSIITYIPIALLFKDHTFFIPA